MHGQYVLFDIPNLIAIFATRVADKFIAENIRSIHTLAGFTMRR